MILYFIITFIGACILGAIVCGVIKRELKVYSVNGTLPYEGSGKFDVDYDDGRIKYVDQHGKVKIIYLGDSASVVVKEIK